MRRDRTNGRLSRRSLSILATNWICEWQREQLGNRWKGLGRQTVIRPSICRPPTPLHDASFSSCWSRSSRCWSMAPFAWRFWYWQRQPFRDVRAWRLSATMDLTKTGPDWPGGPSTPYQYNIPRPLLFLYWQICIILWVAMIAKINRFSAVTVLSPAYLRTGQSWCCCRHTTPPPGGRMVGKN